MFNAKHGMSHSYLFLQYIFRGLLLLSLVQFGNCCFQVQYDDVTSVNFKRSLPFSASLFTRGCNLKIRSRAQLDAISSVDRDLGLFSLRTFVDYAHIRFQDRSLFLQPLISLRFVSCVKLFHEREIYSSLRKFLSNKTFCVLVHLSYILSQTERCCVKCINKFCYINQFYSIKLT